MSTQADVFDAIGAMRHRFPKGRKSLVVVADASRPRFWIDTTVPAADALTALNAARREAIETGEPVVLEGDSSKLVIHPDGRVEDQWPRD